MTPREYWDHYVERRGGLRKLADESGIPYPTLACVSNGSRGIGRKLADRLGSFDPLLDQSQLIWVTATKSPDGDTRAA